MSRSTRRWRRRTWTRAGCREWWRFAWVPPATRWRGWYKEDAAPFDLIFIDADKENIPAYLGWSLKLAQARDADRDRQRGARRSHHRRGEYGPDVQGVRRCSTMMAAEPRLSATAIQTVGAKRLRRVRAGGVWSATEADQVHFIRKYRPVCRISWAAARRGRLAAQPSLVTWCERPMASASAGTGWVMQEPAPT